MQIVVMNSLRMAARPGNIYPDTFCKDKEYELEEELVEVFLRNGWASLKEGQSASKNSISTMSRKELLEFAEANGLEINAQQRVDGIRIEIQEKLK